MLEHFLGSETTWRIWSQDSTRALRDLSTGTFSGMIYQPGAEDDGIALTGTIVGAAGVGVEPSGTPNLTYTPAANEWIAGGIVTGGRWRARIVWSSGDTIVFDGPVQVYALVS